MPKRSGQRIDRCGTTLSTGLMVDTVPLSNKHSLSSSSQIVLEPVEAVLLGSVQLKLAQEKFMVNGIKYVAQIISYAKLD